MTTLIRTFVTIFGLTRNYRLFRRLKRDMCDCMAVKNHEVHMMYNTGNEGGRGARCLTDVKQTLFPRRIPGNSEVAT